ncbi:uncharacterized protein LOC122378989 isoform X2 [Amphibalanus amphitrite]|uniref:uncharacterized protein LOC122367648 isoform X2 n=1 Tax=Amphibalanus amphitrite TaxID=1232801 RepID=UPI001C92315C|nr:uncharacterized protein LOC122367648 isoform X2 [Amphibalanus amphitrite]XP_043196896.1 uncharacterized protein LOC122367648 isoform X2 [Amphibalanus amphitrite]XP_043216712.1 uncharacterized protein LOC122378989 isoform X2 [Amphibalanus amphitrite]XP_043216713.1 uncharacterized protein LOC122378989 isoform X2 [Amphibalanus amphitrite]
MFRVVAFSDAPEVAVVSKKWWSGEEDEATRKPRGFVFWPPCKTSGAVDRLLKAHAEPVRTGTGQWTRHPATSLFATDDLLLARRKAQKAEEESDLTSEAEAVEATTRIRRRNPRFDDDSDEETGTRARREPTGLSRPPPAPRTFGLDGSGGQGTSLSRPANSSPSVQTASVPASTPTSAPRQPSDARQTVILGKILKTVEGILNVVKQNGANIEALRAEISNSQTRPRRMAPLQTLAELDELDKQLHSQRAFFNEVVEQLSACCTMARSDLERNVRSVMRGTVSADLSEHLSLKGKNGKRAIAETVLFDVICETLRRCGGANRDAVGRCVGLWLSGSRDRNGKRLRRLSKTKEAAGPSVAGQAPTDRPPLQPVENLETLEVRQPDFETRQAEAEEAEAEEAEAEEAELPMEQW